jgi:hypothetical protein
VPCSIEAGVFGTLSVGSVGPVDELLAAPAAVESRAVNAKTANLVLSMA